MNLKEEALVAMINEYLAKTDVLVSTHKFLAELKKVIETHNDVTDYMTEEELDETVAALCPPHEEEDQQTLRQHHIQISCDASIKKNPGGPSSVGVIIRHPDQKESIQVSQVTKATTNNQAEYDAVYTGLATLLNVSNRPKYPVIVHSDSQLVINQLRGKSACKDEKLANKRDIILETAKQIEAGVTFEWRPRNSTEDLKNANYLAQDKLNVKRH